jgi:hypothetical protein
MPAWEEPVSDCWPASYELREKSRRNHVERSRAHRLPRLCVGQMQDTSQGCFVRSAENLGSNVSEGGERREEAGGRIGRKRRSRGRGLAGGREFEVGRVK